MTWVHWALLSALFAGITAVLLEFRVNATWLVLAGGTAGFVTAMIGR